MPYIKDELRKVVDDKIDALCDTIRKEIADENLDGVLNYVATRIVVGTLMPARERRYTLIARAVAVFECAKIEFYRRVGGPYEDQCKARNGDLWEING